MTEPRRQRIHASTVALAGKAVVIRGPSGSGKSDLALRLIDAGAGLVADDQTIIERADGTLVAHSPETIRGRIEVRGLGVIGIADAGPTPVALIVDLAPAETIDRMPDDCALFAKLLELDVPRITIDPALPGAVARVRAALDRFQSCANDNVALVSSADR